MAKVTGYVRKIIFWFIKLGTAEEMSSQDKIEIENNFV